MISLSMAHNYEMSGLNSATASFLLSDAGNFILELCTRHYTLSIFMHFIFTECVPDRDVDARG